MDLAAWSLGAWALGARIALALSGLAALSGCSMFLLLVLRTRGGARRACPTVAVLRSLSQTAVFAPGAERKPAGVAFYGILSDVESKCTRSGDAVLVTLDTVVIGERGPASGGATSVDLQYFIAATDRTRRYDSQQAHAAGADSDSRRGAPCRDHRPCPGVGVIWRPPPGDVRVVLGFQQTPEVVQFYKNFRGR